MQLEATMLTLKDSTITVASGNVSTSGALLRGISGINKTNWNALSQGFVFNKPLEHGKSPTVNLPITLPPKVGSAPDVGQLLKNDNGAIKSGSVAHQPLTYVVQRPPMEAVFPAAKSSKDSLSAPGAFALKRATHSKVVVFAPVEFASTKELIRRGDDNILNSQVNPNNTLGGIRRWNKFLQNKVKVEGLIPINKISRAKFPRFILKIASLVVTQDKLAPDSVPIGRKRAVIRFDGAGSGIIADRGKVPEVRPRTLPFEAGFHRLSYFVTSGTAKVRREFKQLTGRIIDLVVQGYFVSKLLIPSNITNPVAGSGVCLYRLKQKLRVLWKKLYSDRAFDFFHIHILTQYKRFVKSKERGCAPIPPTPEGMGFLGAFL